MTVNDVNVVDASSNNAENTDMSVREDVNYLKIINDVDGDDTHSSITGNTSRSASREGC